MSWMSGSRLARGLRLRSGGSSSWYACLALGWSCGYGIERVPLLALSRALPLALLPLRGRFQEKIGLLGVKLPSWRDGGGRNHHRPRWKLPDLNWTG